MTSGPFATGNQPTALASIRAQVHLCRQLADSTLSSYAIQPGTGRTDLALSSSSSGDVTTPIRRHRD